MRCSYESGSYFGGVCDCGNSFYCDERKRACVSSPFKGTMSRAECAASCGGGGGGGGGGAPHNGDEAVAAAV